MGINNLPFPLPPGPDISKPQRRLKRLTTIHTAQGRDPAHYRPVTPHLLNGIPNHKRLEFESRRCGFRHELRLRLRPAGAVEKGVVIGEQPLELGAIAIDLRLVVVLDGFRQIRRQLSGSYRRRSEAGE